MGIRSLYSPCSKPHGTCFSMDSSTFADFVNAADMMEFERNLAAIIAVTQPVSDKRNPFFFNKFYGTKVGNMPWWLTWTEQHWNCKNNCHAADVLMDGWLMNHHWNEGTSPGFFGPSGVKTHGCTMCRALFDGKVSTKCHNRTTNELMVAIVNSNFDDSPPESPLCNSMNRVMIGTSPAANLVNMDSWTAPNGLAYQVSNIVMHRRKKRY